MNTAFLGVCRTLCINYVSQPVHPAAGWRRPRRLGRLTRGVRAPTRGTGGANEGDDGGGGVRAVVAATPARTQRVEGEEDVPPLAGQHKCGTPAMAARTCGLAPVPWGRWCGVVGCAGIQEVLSKPWPVGWSFAAAKRESALPADHLVDVHPWMATCPPPPFRAHCQISTPPPSPPLSPDGRKVGLPLFRARGLVNGRQQN